MSNWQTKELKELARVILQLKSIDDVEKFLRDLCTLEELEEMTKRWQMVKMINQDISFREIAKKLKTSTTTVTRVAHWFYDGEGGYQMMLKRMK